MGSGRDKRKKAKPKAAGAGVAKTERKTDQNSEKQQRRLERQAQGGEDDIDSLLAQFKLEDDTRSTVRVEENCPPPTPRVYASFTPIPSQKENELIMFGGEYYDHHTDKTHVYSDLYVLNVEKQAWRRVISPKGPLPRTSHQAVCTRQALWVFGGEFTSLNQENYKHFSDLWRLNLADWSWENISPKGGPSPRSGHRMVLHGRKILLFGGFNDTGKHTRYFNDLWCFDLEELRWTLLGPKESQLAPAARGGCQLAVAGDHLFVFGGYSVKKVEQDKSSFAPKKLKKGEEDDDGKGVVHDDVWMVDLKTLQWERVKKQGMAPTPRTSFAMAAHRKRTLLFGGLFDREGAGDKVYTESFNELYQFNLENRRWFPVVMRLPRKQQPADSSSQEEQQQGSSAGMAGVTGAGPEAAADSGGSSGGGGEAAGEEQQQAKELPPGVSKEMAELIRKLAADKGSALHRAATRIQSSYRGYRVRQAYQTYRLGGQVSELLYSPATYGIDLSSKDLLKPRSRAAPMMAVLRDTLWLWGGMVEVEHTDIVLDDLWQLDIKKLDGWKCVKENSVPDADFEQQSSEGDSSEWESE